MPFNAKKTYHYHTSELPRTGTASEVTHQTWGRERIEAYLLQRYGTVDPDPRRNADGEQMKKPIFKHMGRRWES